MNELAAKENPPEMICLGGGYLDGGNHHSGGSLQFEHRWGKYIWNHLRPGLIFILPKFCSFYMGLGISYEWFLKEKVIVIPSFYTGVYYKGKGRNLGYLMEFRSSIELNYVLDNDCRLGIQWAHLSNAHLSHRNPGLNTVTLFIGFPIF